jgi:SAM-dependent methyltransferase
MAAGYAFGRPPVHPRLVAAIGRRLRSRIPLPRALDVGSGAGVSTAALGPLARMLVGVEPAIAMMAHVATVAPRASFVAGVAEQLPFSDESFDLIAAAGAINYMDRDAFLLEAVRVLTPDGILVVYDFSAGRHIRDSTALDEWYAEFEREFPAQPGYAIDVRTLELARFGLTLDAYEELEVAVPMTLDSYVRYAMSETNVHLAIAAGRFEREIEGWCRRTLEPVFGREWREVLFSAYVAYVVRLKVAPSA